jgi:hypothetical protein
LIQWLDQVIRDHPAGPTRDDADAGITEALAALESRIEQSSTQLGNIIDPLRDQVARLEAESVQILNPNSERQKKTAAEITRQLERLDRLDRTTGPSFKEPAEPNTDASSRSGQTRRATTGLSSSGRPIRDSQNPRDTLPPLASIQRHRTLRMIAGIGTIAVLALLASGWIWLWYDHEQLAVVKPPITKPKLIKPSADQTPPAAVRGITSRSSTPTTPATAAHIQALKTRAQGQNTDAAYELGIALMQGQGAPVNTREGGEWLAQAALDGHPKAQLELGRLYAKGIGFTRDSQQAFFWVQSAADQGITEAEHALGMIYTQGDGTTRSHALAARWFRKAAAKNFAPSLYQLGLIYELGLDYRINKRRALDWYRKGAAAGSAVAADKVRALEAAGILPTVVTPTPPLPRQRGGAQNRATAKSPGFNETGIAEIQRLLKSLDFDAGPADGKTGTKTIEAIRLYQGMAGLPVDGKPSQKLLDQIREVTGAQKR